VCVCGGGGGGGGGIGCHHSIVSRTGGSLKVSAGGGGGTKGARGTNRTHAHMHTRTMHMHTHLRWDSPREGSNPVPEAAATQPPSPQRAPACNPSRRLCDTVDAAAAPPLCT
jgi:hypothetical protein